MTLDEVARHFALEALYTDYSHCLDDDALEAWPDFFTADCRYRIVSAGDHAAGRPIGLIYATSRDMLVDRVTALRQANIYEPQRYRHLLSGRRIVADHGDSLDLVTAFLVVRIMQDGASMIFATGRYLDTVQHDGSAWHFAARTIVLDSRRIDTLLAIPL